MSNTFRFFSPGTPVPKGSIRAFVPKGWTRPVLTSTSGQPLKAWQSSVTYTAMQNGLKATDAAVSLDIGFVMPRPKSMPKRVTQHVKKPDIDKLARSVLDALTGVAYQDDSQVVLLTCRKQYTTDGKTGAWISVTTESEVTP